MELKKMLLIYNPSSGKGEFKHLLWDVVDRFTKAGYIVTAYPTRQKNDAYTIIAERAHEFGCLCCSGGDGMLNECINAIMALENKPLFGYIPSGTTNDFATTLNIPRDIASAANAVISGIPYSIDVGCFGSKYFAYVAAFGMFTEVTYETPQDNKNILGHAAYLLEGVKRLGSIKAYNCKINIDGEKFSGNFILAMISNSISVGGFKLHDKDVVRLDDGLFEVLLIKQPRSFVDLQNIVSSLLNHEIYTESLIARHAKSVQVVTKEALPWTLDGEFGGETTDILIENIQRSLEIMTPKPAISIN